MITIVLPISRSDFLKPVFDCLIKLQRPKDTEIILMVDGDDTLHQKVERRMEQLNYARIRLVTFGDSPAEDVDSRRYRISAIHNKAGEHLDDDCEFVFLTEDDTTYPPDTLMKLRTVLISNKWAKFAQGVELGRHKTPYIGAWTANDLKEPTEFKTVLAEKGLQKIDAGGLYCALADSKLYKAHHFEPFDKDGKNGLSCDLNFGLHLRRLGYKCFVDHDIQCDHIGEHGSVNSGNTAPVQVVFKKSRTGIWRGSRV